jgi:hypothetical protein
MGEILRPASGPRRPFTLEAEQTSAPRSITDDWDTLETIDAALTAGEAALLERTCTRCSRPKRVPLGSPVRT